MAVTRHRPTGVRAARPHHGGRFVTRTSQGIDVSDLPVPRSGEAEVPRTAPDLPRVLTNLRHGDHVTGEDVSKVDPTRAEDATEWAKVKRTSTPFRYMFDDLQDLY